MEPIMTCRFARNLAPLMALAAVAAPLAASAQSVEIKGMISAREGHRLEVTSQDGTKTELTLTDSTKVTAISGKLGLSRNDGSPSDLITGLPVDIDAQQNGAELDALKVTYKSGDMKTARQIEAGTAQAKANARAKAEHLQAQNDEMRKRLSEANQYDEKGQTTVLFNTGSTAISSQGRSQLQDIATKAKGIKGYLVSVIGYADTTGNPDANQRLSERRAAAVIAYLQKSCGLQPQRVLAGDAMGDAHQVGDASSSQGKAQNRRVVVKVLTNKGLEGL
jgi:outer membrane protein OmpA-like peptidoglycan-associated protein